MKLPELKQDESVCACVRQRPRGDIDKKGTGCTNSRLALTLSQPPVSTLMAEISALNIAGDPRPSQGRLMPNSSP